MPDDVETPAAGDQASDVVPKKRLITLVSTKGKSPQEAAAEVMANFRKYQGANE